MDPTGDLHLLLASRHPLIVAGVDDEERFLAVLRAAAATAGVPVWTWSLTRGLARDGNDPQVGTADPRKAVDFVATLSDPGAFVFLDLHPASSDPAVVRRLKEAALAAEPGQTLVLTGPTTDVPAELEGLALRWTLEPPSREEVEELVRRTFDDLAARGVPVVLDVQGRAQLIDTLLGLTLREAERLVLRAALRDGRLADEDVAVVRDLKAELLEADGILELVGADAGDLDAVGGLEELKDWFRVRGRALEPGAKEFGLDPPKGVLLTGVPGCGKSLVAKALARTWKLPLVLLDPSRLFGPYLGESERRLERALATVVAMAPLVLWIDEIEKGFAAGPEGGDGGAARRVLGSFLRWMQERPAGVFIVATCNDVGLLPPEFMRRGRFDEVFFVDLPDAEEREAIFRVQLERRGRGPDAFELASVARATEGFSGAEIEGVVVAALYRAYADGCELSIAGLLQEAAATMPLSRTRAEDVERLRAWSQGRAVLASRPTPDVPA